MEESEKRLRLKLLLHLPNLDHITYICLHEVVIDHIDDKDQIPYTLFWTYINNMVI